MNVRETSTHNRCHITSTASSNDDEPAHRKSTSAFINAPDEPIEPFIGESVLSTSVCKPVAIGVGRRTSFFL